MLPNQDAITERIIGAAIEVHRHVGPGQLESFYRECLCYELKERHIPFEREVTIPLRYKNLNIEAKYRLDLLVANYAIVELKAVDSLHPVHIAQGLTYLAATGLPICLLINFNTPVLVKGIKRLIRGEPRPVTA